MGNLHTCRGEQTFLHGGSGFGCLISGIKSTQNEIVLREPLTPKRSMQKILVPRCIAESILWIIRDSCSNPRWSRLAVLIVGDKDFAPAFGCPSGLKTHFLAHDAIPDHEHAGHHGHSWFDETLTVLQKQPQPQIPGFEAEFSMLIDQQNALCKSHPQLPMFIRLALHQCFWEAARHMYILHEIETIDVGRGIEMVAWEILEITRTFVRQCLSSVTVAGKRAFGHSRWWISMRRFLATSAIAIVWWRLRTFRYWYGSSIGLGLNVMKRRGRHRLGTVIIVVLRCWKAWTSSSTTEHLISLTRELNVDCEGTWIVSCLGDSSRVHYPRISTRSSRFLQVRPALNSP